MVFAEWRFNIYSLKTITTRVKAFEVETSTTGVCRAMCKQTYYIKLFFIHGARKQLQHQADEDPVGANGEKIKNPHRKEIPNINLRVLFKMKHFVLYFQVHHRDHRLYHSLASFYIRSFPLVIMS